VTRPDSRQTGEMYPTVVRIDQIDQSKGQVAHIRGQCFGASNARRYNRPGVRRACGERPEQLYLTLSDDPVCVVGIRAENAAGATIVTRHRAVGERVVGLFAISVSLHDEQQGLVIRPLVT